MSLVRTRFDSVFAKAICLLTLGLALAVPSTQAEERVANELAVEQVAPLSQRNYREIITELPPLKPYKRGVGKAVTKAANPVQSVLDSAKQSEQLPVSAPAQQPAAATAENPAPVASAPIASSAEAKPTPLAEAPTTPSAPGMAAVSPTTPANEKPSPEIVGNDAPTAKPIAQGERAAQSHQPSTTEPSAPAPVADALPAPAKTAPPALTETPKASAPLDPARLAAIIAEGVKGPAEVRLENRAVYTLPEGRIFLPKEKARELVLAAGHQWDDATIGAVIGASTGSDWIAFVDLLDDGYIKDDGASNLDATKLLDAYRASVAAGNDARIRAGARPLSVTGWVDAPRYDEKHRFVSCVAASAEPADDPKNGVVNCTSYALGRSGAFRVIVATGGEGYDKVRGEAANIVEAIAFDPGKGYADADVAKDPIAPYGLMALASGASPGKQSSVAPARAAHSGSDRLFNLAGIIVGVLGIAGLIARRFMAKKPAAPASQPRAASSVDAKSLNASPGFFQALRSRFAAARERSPAKASAPAAAQSKAPAQEPEQGISALFKLGALMRKKAPASNYVAVNADRLARQTRPSARAVLQGGAPEGIIGPDADAVESTAELASSSEPKHELIEPGAAEADALRAREPQRASA
jgi:uncharacterized membrane-anchored protein